MEDEELHVEGFGAWVLAAQLIASQLSGVTTTALSMLQNVDSKLGHGNEIVEVDRLPSNVSSGAVKAYHLQDGTNTIYIYTGSPVYKAAKAGSKQDIIKLASIIAHEAYHVQHGPAEKPAYSAQIKVLRNLGASPGVIGGLIQSMDSVTN